MKKKCKGMELDYNLDFLIMRVGVQKYLYNI